MTEQDQSAASAADQAPDVDEEKLAIWKELQAEDEGREPQPTDDRSVEDADEAEAESSSDDDANAPPPEDTEGDDGEGDERADDASDAGADDVETLKRALEQEQVARKREAGRQTALQRQIQDLQTKLAAQSAPPKLSEKEIKERDERIKQLREDYPDVATPILEEVERRNADTAAKLEALEAAQQRQQQSESLTQVAKLEEIHPNYQGFFQEHQDAILQWAETDAPVRVHRALYDNLKQLVNAEAAAEALTMFKRHAGIETPGETPPESGTDQKLTVKRKRQQAAAAAPAISSPRMRSTGEPSEEAPKEDHWKYWQEQERKGLA